MAETATPIRADVRPGMDAGREMVQFVAEKINEYVEQTGVMPCSIAVALIGENEADHVSFAASWSPGDENKSRLHCCAVAAALLWKRALGL